MGIANTKCTSIARYKKDGELAPDKTSAEVGFYFWNSAGSSPEYAEAELA